MNKISLACVSVAIVLTLAGLFVGCSKSEQSKEVIDQQAPPATAAVVTTGGSTIAEFTFEDGIQEWSSHQKGITLKQNTAENHGGTAGLELSGTSNSGIWNFGGSPRFKLDSGKHYRFSVWIKVKSYESSNEKLMCLVKIGIYKDNKNIKVVDKKYNLTQIGTWQLLSGEFEAPAYSDLFGNIAIGKNMPNENVAATIYLDDIRIAQTN